jgi:cobalt-zinc-cadmium efflux system membrane fusion protein
MKLAAIVFLVLAAACSGPKQEPVLAKSDAPRGGSSEIRLDTAAQKEAGIVVQPVTVRSVPETIHATGRITFNENRSWRVGAITDGRVLKVDANVGDAIQQGQVLARMHSHDVHESRASYLKAQMELSRLKAGEIHARRIRDRAKRLLELKAASVEQVENAEAEWKNASSAVEQAGVELERTRVHITDFLGLSLDEKTAHGDDDLIPIRSPASGTLILRHVTTGTVVQTAGEMFVITDLNTVWMIASVNEEHFQRLRVGMPVRVSVQAHPGHPFHGRLSKLGEQLDPATRTVQARIELANPKRLLKPEMYADAELDLPGQRPAVFVPETSIQELKGQSVVFLRKGESSYEAQAIELGRGANGLVEIMRGVPEGALVVTQGAFVLKSQLLKTSLAEE